MSNTEKVRKEALLTENELCHAVEYIRLSPSFRDELLRVAQAQMDRLLSDPLVRVVTENQEKEIACGKARLGQGRPEGGEMKIIDFKTVSPLFELERDGEKLFTARLIDLHDKRFKSLSQWQPESKWGLRITNPATGESFIRKIVSASRFHYLDFSETVFTRREKTFYNWCLLILGEKVGVG